MSEAKSQQLPNDEGFIVSEGNGAISREEVTLSENKIVYAATVLAQIAATNAWVEYQGEATDGSEVARAICCRRVDCRSGPQQVAVIARYAEVRRTDLVWRDGMSDNDKTAGIADLKTFGIIVRDGPPATSISTQTI